MKISQKTYVKPEPKSRNPYLRRTDGEMIKIVKNIESGLISIRPACFKYGLNRNTLKLFITKLSIRTLGDDFSTQIRSRMNDRRFNIDPILAANRNANAIYNRNVSNASGGDRSRLLSNLMGGLQARYGADASAYSQKNNMDNQYLGQQAEMDYNLGAMNAQALAMSDDLNARNLAAKRNFGASAASGMQRYALNQMQMNNQMNSQNAYLDVLQRVNPFFNQWLGINDLRNYNKR